MVGIDVSTIRDEGWTGKKYGELIAVMKSAGFDLLLTVDQNIPYQQNLTTAGIAIIVMKAKSNRLADLLPIVPSVLNELSTIQCGDFVVLS